MERLKILLKNAFVVLNEQGTEEILLPVPVEDYLDDIYESFRRVSQKQNITPWKAARQQFLLDFDRLDVYFRGLKIVSVPQFDFTVTDMIPSSLRKTALVLCTQTAWGIVLDHVREMFKEKDTEIFSLSQHEDMLSVHYEFPQKDDPTVLHVTHRKSFQRLYFHRDGEVSVDLFIHTQLSLEFYRDENTRPHGYLRIWTTKPNSEYHLVK